MNPLDCITLIGGGGGFVALIWTIVNWRAKRKTETANADLAAAEADGRVSDNWARYAEKLEQRLQIVEEQVKADRIEREQMRQEFDAKEASYKDTIAELRIEVARLKAINDHLTKIINDGADDKKYHKILPMD